VHDQTGDDHGAPADPVGQRSCDQLAQEQRKRVEAEPKTRITESQMDRVDRQERQCAGLTEGEKRRGGGRHQSLADDQRFGPVA